MNVIIKNDYRVEVMLSREELHSLDITYDELDYGNVDTRRVLWTLLSEVRRNCGTDIDLSGRMLIEVNRETGDRTRICFTSLPPRGENAPSVKQLVKYDEKPLIIECGDLDDVVSAAVNSGFDGSSGLFYDGVCYRLILDVPERDRKTVAARICEFGELLNGNEERVRAECSECWKCIEGEHAVEKLRQLA